MFHFNRTGLHVFVNVITGTPLRFSIALLFIFLLYSISLSIFLQPHLSVKYNSPRDKKETLRLNDRSCSFDPVLHDCIRSAVRVALRTNTRSNKRSALYLRTSTLNHFTFIQIVSNRSNMISEFVPRAAPV